MPGLSPDPQEGELQGNCPGSRSFEESCGWGKTAMSNVLSMAEWDVCMRVREVLVLRGKPFPKRDLKQFIRWLRTSLLLTGLC